MVDLLRNIHRRMLFAAPAIRLESVVDDLLASSIHEFRQLGGRNIHCKLIDHQVTFFAPRGNRYWNKHDQQDCNRDAHSGEF